jgi:hypothetical protein
VLLVRGRAGLARRAMETPILKNNQLTGKQ